jgi:hypothetical protein
VFSITQVDAVTDAGVKVGSAEVVVENVTP